MKVALVLTAPKHTAPVFTEIIELYAAYLSDLGHEVIVSPDRFKKDYLNIVFAYQYLPPESFSIISKNYRYIICQLELLGNEGGWFGSDGRKFSLMHPLFQSAIQIWDFAIENIEYLKREGFSARLIQPGYHSSLSRCLPAVQQDIDVLFYGSYGAPGSRRFELLGQLENSCNLVRLNNVYGRDRDQAIAQSKIVLNIHYSSVLTHTEQVRISYLLNNQALVISEHCARHPYGDDLVSYPYDELIPEILNWLKKDETERHQYKLRGLERLKQIPMQEALSAALVDI